MRPYFRCRHCRKRLVPLVPNFGQYMWGRERICPRCGKIWRLNLASQQMLVAFGVIVGIIFTVVARQWIAAPEGELLVFVLWLPVYVFILWPAMFALLGNYRLK